MLEDEITDEELRHGAMMFFDQMHYDKYFGRFIDDYVKNLWDQYEQGNDEARDKLAFIRNYCVTDLYDEDDITPLFMDGFRKATASKREHVLHQKAARTLKGTAIGVAALTVASFFEQQFIHGIIPTMIAGYLLVGRREMNETKRQQEKDERFEKRVDDAYGSLHEAFAGNLYVQRASIADFLEEKGF